MCLYTNRKIKVLKQDTIVYKSLDKVESRAVESVNPEGNLVRTTTIRVKSAIRGYHYKFGKKNPKVNIGVTDYSGGQSRVDAGYHYFLHKPTQSLGSKEVYVECIIPAGSKYIDDIPQNLGVADQIIITGICA